MEPKPVEYQIFATEADDPLMDSVTVLDASALTQTYPWLTHFQDAIDTGDFQITWINHLQKFEIRPLVY